MKNVRGSSAYLASSCPYIASLLGAYQHVRLCGTASLMQNLSDLQSPALCLRLLL